MGVRTNGADTLDALESRNAELSSQLEDLQAETAQADRQGKQRLRKLDKEIAQLRDELDRATLSNAALEAKLARESFERPKRTGPNHQTTSSDGSNIFVDDSRSYEWPPKPLRDLDGLMLESAQPNNDPDGGNVLSPPLTPLDERAAEPKQSDSVKSDLSSLASSTGDDTPRRAEKAVVAELMAKIAELEDANANISTQKQEMDERLARAQFDLDTMKRSYEELEDEMTRSEREFSYSDIPAISWPEVRKRGVAKCSRSQSQSTSPYTRRAQGNRRLIERQKRSSDISPSSSIKSQLSAASSSSASPSRLRVDRFTGKALRRKSSSSSFFDDQWDARDDREDVLVAIRRQDNERMGRKSSGISLKQRSLASELGDGELTLESGVKGNRADPDDYIDSNTDLLARGALLDDPSRPDEEVYDELDRAATELPVAFVDDEFASPSKRRAAQSIGWVAEDIGDAPDPWSSTSGIESESAVRERHVQEMKNERRRLRLRKLAKLLKEDSEATFDDQVDTFDHSRSTTASDLTIQGNLSTGQLLRRQWALRRLGVDHEWAEDEEPTLDVGELATNHDFGDDDRDEPDEDDFHAVAPLDYDFVRKGDYWPVALAARLHPRTVAARVGVAASFMMLYARFVTVLLIALLGAIWAGPDKANRRTKKRLN